MSALVALSTEVAYDGSSLLRLSAPPNTLVSWSVQSGGGLISPLSPATDASGTAYAVYYPAGAAAGPAVLRATYGA